MSAGTPTSARTGRPAPRTCTGSPAGHPGARARARPGRIRREQTSLAGPSGREHPRVGPEMPSPTCHFAWSCSRGCSHDRRLEPPEVRARECARMCVCEILLAVQLTYCSRRHRPPPPIRAGRQAPSRGARPRPLACPRPPPPSTPASPPSRRTVLTSVESGGLRGLLREAEGSGGSLRLPARPPGLGCPRLLTPPPLSGPPLPTPQTLSLPPRSRLPASEPELSPRSLNLPRLRSMPSAARPSWAGGGQGPDGRLAAASRWGREGAPGGRGVQPSGPG